MAALAGGLFFGSCADGSQQRGAVAFRDIEVSADRRTLTVSSSYPTKPFCAKEPDGVDVEIVNGVATVTAYLRSPKAQGLCTMECDIVTQRVTLEEALPEGIRFEPPPGIDPGCG